MPYLVVCPASQIETVGMKHKPSHMLTVMGENTSVPRPATVRVKNHKTLIFNDISTEHDGLLLPTSAHIEAILNFGRNWNQSAPLLIHCYAGVSRSTASAYIIASAMAEERDPVVLAKDLRLRAPTATPNAKMVSLADKLLAKEGAMVDAINGIGRGAYCYEGTPFVFPLKREHAHLFL